MFSMGGSEEQEWSLNFLLLYQPQQRMCLQWVYELRAKHFLCLFLSRDTKRRLRGREEGWMEARARPDGRNPVHIKL